jgi:putative ATP-dependent endonuclease of OLD family
VRLRQVIVKNFRNLAEVTLLLGDTTVLVGENNAGKTSFLHALRAALPRNLSLRAELFDDYDYRMSQAGDNPHSVEGITIELWFREDAPDEWPDTLIQALSEIIQTEAETDLDCIGLRLSGRYDADSKRMITAWEFLNLNGEPMAGRQRFLSRFLRYVRLFYMPALRDPDEQFSMRSQFWGPILRDMRIDPEEGQRIAEGLKQLNDAMLKADPKLEQVRAFLQEAQKLLGLGGQTTSIQAVPLRPSELMTKSQVVVRGKGSEIDFPLFRHGQGVQSLAVLFLFQAYLAVLMKTHFEQETEAILALEEPEAHLHPQAARALGTALAKMSGQKIISTHSPYLIQEIPLRDIRMFRSSGPESKILSVKRSFSANVPPSEDLLRFCERNSDKFKYEKRTATLFVSSVIEKEEYRRLLRMYPGGRDVHANLRKLFLESFNYVSDRQLEDLETYVKRMRGEVLFARGWLLCEGQSEYPVLRYFAELTGHSLDAVGIAVIDFQNNGSPGAFVRLARSFEIPWLMIHDSDAAGRGFKAEVSNGGLTPEELDQSVRSLPGVETDFEKYLAMNGFAGEYVEILEQRGKHLAKQPDQDGFYDEVVEEVRKDKTGFAFALVRQLRLGDAGQDRVPAFLKEAIDEIIKRTG